MAPVAGDVACATDCISSLRHRLRRASEIVLDCHINVTLNLSKPAQLWSQKGIGLNTGTSDRWSGLPSLLHVPYAHS